MQYRPIHAFLIAFLLITELIHALLSAPQPVIEEKKTPYNEYEEQFLKEQGVFDTTVIEESPGQLFAGKRQGLK